MEFSEEDLVGLLCRNPQSVKKLLEKALHFAQYGRYRKQLDPDDYVEIAEDTVLEVLEKVDNVWSTPDEVVIGVQRSVWRLSQRRYRQKQKEFQFSQLNPNHGE